MPRHDVEIELPAKVVLHKDVLFTVKSDGVMLGELRVSKGSIDWRPANKQTPIQLDWERFDAVMRRA
ncbi:MAG TPA: hypothetical protein VID03_03490 [Acidimicrobiia bacterium]